MFDEVFGWIVNHAGTLLIGCACLAGLAIVAEAIWPCLFRHNYQDRIENYHDSSNVTSYTVGFYCTRCGKKD